MQTVKSMINNTGIEILTINDLIGIIGAEI